MRLRLCLVAALGFFFLPLAGCGQRPAPAASAAPADREAAADEGAQQSQAPGSGSAAAAPDSGDSKPVQSSGAQNPNGQARDKPAGGGDSSIDAAPPAGASPEDLEQLAKERARQAVQDDEPLPAGPPPAGDLRTRTFGSDWPAFLGPTGDGKSPEKGILTKWPLKGPRVVWSRRVGEGYSPVVISRGRLYEFSRVGDMARCTCRRSETGEPLWRFEYPTNYEDYFGYSNGPRCSPLVDGDRLYLFGAEGMLLCLHAETGQLLWKRDTAREYGVVQNFFGVGSAPVVEGDLLIVQIGGSDKKFQNTPPGALDRVKGNGSGIVAFDKRTGAERYRITDELASYASPVLATIAGRRWCFMFARGGLVGFEPSSGHVDFHFPWRARLLESVNASNPVVAENQVLITETYGPGSALLEVAPGKCRVVWSDEDKGRDASLKAHWNTPIYHEGYVYACSGRHPHGAEIRCLEWKTGNVLWAREHFDFRHPLTGQVTEEPIARASLTYVDGHFLCLGEYGPLLLIKANPQKFELVAQALLLDESGPRPQQLVRYPAWSAPVLSHGLVYLRGEGRLVCLELIPPPENK